MILVRDPIYQQLNAALRQLAGSGEFAKGARFLTERQVSERFGVSRPTANKALASLVSEGLLEFRKGVGTFVSGGGLDYDLRSLVSFTDRARAAGKRPTTRVLRFEQVAAEVAPAEVRRALRVGAGEDLFRLERLRLADGVPMILERRWVTAGLCPGLRAKDAEGSLYGLWSGRYGLEIAGAEQAIRAISVGAADAKLLKVRRGAAGLLVLATGTLADGRPLWTEQTLYRADRYEFHTHLGALRPARPAMGRFAELGNN